MTDTAVPPRRRVRTNDELAEALDISFSMASRLRNGHRYPSAALMIRMARVFGIPLEEIAAARERGLEAFGEFMRARVYLPD